MVIIPLSFVSPQVLLHHLSQVLNPSLGTEIILQHTSVIYLHYYMLIAYRGIILATFLTDILTKVLVYIGCMTFDTPPT